MRLSISPQLWQSNTGATRSKFFQLPRTDLDLQHFGSGWVRTWTAPGFGASSHHLLKFGSWNLQVAAIGTSPGAVIGWANVWFCIQPLWTPFFLKSCLPWHRPFRLRRSRGRSCPPPVLFAHLLPPWRPHCNSLVSHQGEVEILLAASCYRNHDKLGSYEPALVPRLHFLSTLVYQTPNLHVTSCLCHRWPQSCVKSVSKAATLFGCWFTTEGIDNVAEFPVMLASNEIKGVVYLKMFV